MRIAWSAVEWSVRHIHLTLLLYLFLVFGGPFLSSADAVDLIEPWRVTVEGRSGKATYMVSAVQEFGCGDLLHPRQWAAFSSSPYYTFENAQGFQASTGLAEYVAPTGKMWRLRFWTVSGPEVFHKFVNLLAERRGTAVAVLGGEFQKRITVPPPPKVPGKPHVKWDDINVVYVNGLVVLSSHDDLFSLPLGRLSEIVKEAEGKSWYWRLDPNAVPEAIRSRFFSTIQAQMGITFQKRDHEDDRTYLLRRTTGEGYLGLVNSLIFEIKEIVAWTAWPTDDAPFRSRFEIHARPDTRLASLIEMLGSREQLIESLSDSESVGTINGSVTVPTEGQQILDAILKQAVADDSVVSRLLSETINAGQLEFAAGISLAADGMPILKGGLRMAPIDVTAVELATATNGSVDMNGNTVTFVNPILAGMQLGEQQFVFRVNEGLLEFCASAVAVSIREDVVQHRRPNPRKGPLLELKLDFARWAERPAESLETQFVQKLETIFDRWQFAQFTNRVVEQRRRSIAEEAFPSFVDRLQIDHDLKIEAQVRTADGVLVADCEIGTDLHKLYVARTLLLAARALPLVRPDLQRQK